MAAMLVSAATLVVGGCACWSRCGGSGWRLLVLPLPSSAHPPATSLSTTRIVISGEGSDEIFGSYLYFHKAPNKVEFHREMKALHQYDCLRANKATSAWGIEATRPWPSTLTGRWSGLTSEGIRRRPPTNPFYQRSC
ncbi:hypothetical protein E2562_033869 [Oryza meyeriana var. granulata]|uniref:Asparagine synthetase domain-containing protein n=1 Tax=Oryza meyeriana var. granulata TaxID=110450 RepID=A0A6G1BQ64_9ORYZ|nr:hypothetical protein E2562_033869 [Oryza meyeriana var. granulata]